ncbi:hypothetical protein JD844_028909 [Phrynosoma platyrhinos]|uniref:Tsg C-terminal domain-containing protein n=1 Tax=Phrynosoma platyrhinos TaxID=52577 RepID=A0ABQ7SIL8_PHRPL|nr:hypothetical protein JD844_028909 [Phrynosoma platyrhinos]
MVVWIRIESVKYHRSCVSVDQVKEIAHVVKNACFAWAHFGMSAVTVLVHVSIIEGMCNPRNYSDTPPTSKSTVEELHEPIPSLFRALTEERMCTVVYFDDCMSIHQCKISCESMGASKYRWFHNACCECIGPECIDYGSKTDDTEENSNDGSQPSKRRRMGSGDSSRSCETSSQDLSFSYFPAENLIEYKWPPDETGEYYMLQEQVSEYLGVTSFKRKYPDLERRDLSHKEKLYLRELNVITETQCTLGLTALRSDEVIDLMIKEYPAKHAEYSQMQQQNTQKVEASKVPEYIKKAAKKAAEFNSNLNRERMEERRAYFDLQTHVIQVPQGKYKILPTERTKVSPYPVALIPGQFQEYYKRYSPDELRYLPLNTALYEPPLDPELPALDSDGDSDDAEERGDEKRKIKGNSDNSSGNVSEGEVPLENQDEPIQGRQKTRERNSTPRKEGSKRSVSKSVPGYKVEEKSP